MATEYQLSFSAHQVNERLKTVEINTQKIEQVYQKIDTIDEKLNDIDKNANNINKIDETLGTVNNDISQIFEDIDKIKVNGADDHIAGAIIESAKDSLVSLKDSAHRPLQDLKLFGKSKQKQFSGKNLFNKDIPIGQMYNDGHGYYSINIFVGEGATVTASIAKKYNAQTKGGYLFIIPNGDLNKENTPNSLRSWLYHNDNTGDCNVSQTVISTDGYISIFFTEGSHELFKNELQVEIGDKKTTYETYVGGRPSPNPDYPQEIVNAGGSGSVEVEVYGKNLFGGTGYQLFPLYLKKGTNITVSCSNVGTTVFGIYGENKERLTYWTINENGSGRYCKPISLLQDVYYVMFDIWNEGKSKEYQLELGSVATNYELYKPKQSLPISTPNGLPAIEVTDSSLVTYTDADGKMWCADEIDLERGKYVQRIDKYEFTGEGHYDDFTKDHYAIAYKIAHLNETPLLCSHSPIGDNSTIWANENYIRFNINYWNVSTVEEFKTFLAEKYAAGDPVYIYYVLPEPIEIDLTEELIQEYKKLYTYYPITNIINNKKCKMNVKYVADTKNYIDERFALINTRISALETFLNNGE